MEVRFLMSEVPLYVKAWGEGGTPCMSRREGKVVEVHARSKQVAYLAGKSERGVGWGYVTNAVR